MRAAIYARYSSDRQTHRSIDDQVRLCRDFADKEGFEIVEVFTDAAISGAHAVNRPGFAALMEGVGEQAFDIVLSEALDRLARSQKDTADLFERIEYNGLRLVTLAEGEVNELHVGMKGTINAVFLRDLKKKIRRGMSGLVAEGRAAGGIGYGYRVRREIGPDGELVRGLRDIVPEEAEIIRRIFREYAAGRTGRDIAGRLNADNIPSPAGGRWNASTINGSRQRRVGILYNEAYIGFLVWNRSTMIKNPDTGRRTHRINPPEDWQVVEKPEWRIVTDDEWEAAHAVKDRYSGLHQGHKVKRRPKRLLSGILKCGSCGGSWTVLDKHRSCCSRRRESGECDNPRKVSMKGIEERVFSGLRRELLDPSRVRAAMADIRRQVERQRKSARRNETGHRKELRQIETAVGRIIAAIEAGAFDDALRRRLDELAARRKAIEAELESMDRDDPVIELLPNLEDAYKRKVETLAAALDNDEDRPAAMQAVRQIFDRIEIHPEPGRGKYRLEVVTALPYLLDAKKNGSGTGRGVAVVAEEGFEPPTRGL